MQHHREAVMMLWRWWMLLPQNALRLHHVMVAMIYMMNPKDKEELKQIVVEA